MATTSNIRSDGGGQACKGPVCCMDCMWSNLHRYGSNPVLAQCTMKPNDGNARFPYQVEVARAPRMCQMYRHHAGEKFIQQRVRTAA